MSALLEVRNLFAGYGDVAVLRDVSFAVADGAITALIGSNGSGKTTAMRTLAGLLPARSGQIHLAGRDLTAARPGERVEAGLALVPEGRLVFPEFTVEETLRVGAYCARARAGAPERTMYGPAGIGKFAQIGTVVYQSPGVTIYRIGAAPLYAAAQ